MDDITYIIAVLAIFIGGLAGVAHLLDKRHQKLGALGPKVPELGSMGRILLWVIRILVAVMVLAVIGTFGFGMPFLIWIAAGCLVLYLIVGRVFQVIRLAGK